MNVNFQRIQDFFNSLTQEEILILSLGGLLVFTLGLLLGWWIQRRATRQYQHKAQALRTEIEQLQIIQRQITEEVRVTKGKLVTVQEQKQAALDQIEQLESDQTQYTQRLNKLNDDVESLQATRHSLSATVESLNDQVIGLKTQNEHLRNTEQGADAGAVPEEEGQVGTSPDYANSNDQLEERLQYLEGQLASVHDRLFSIGSAGPASARSELYPTTPMDEEGEPTVIRADTTQPGIRYGGHPGAEIVVENSPPPTTSVGSGQVANHDDLTAIKHIGPFLQRQLHAADIFHYEQIANWTEADIATYTQLIGYLPGIIERDDWVGQARQLAATRRATEEPGSSEKASPTDSPRATGGARIISTPASDSNSVQNEL